MRRRRVQFFPDDDDGGPHVQSAHDAPLAEPGSGTLWQPLADPTADEDSAAEAFTEWQFAQSDPDGLEDPEAPAPVVMEPQEQLTQEEYEALFPLPPEPPRAATTYDLFSDEDRFTQETIASSPHFLVQKLGGTLWLDVNSDGVRGSSTDPTLNAYEHDRAVSGVKVELVSCATDEVVSQTRSHPDPGPLHAGGGATLLRTQVSGAGDYGFLPPNGRYYLMYKAPQNYQILGNVLPLRRDPPPGQGDDFDCLPFGGEGDGYLDEVRQNGDLDNNGYCARSIGCLEVNWRYLLEGAYDDVTPLGEATGARDTDTLVAVPSPDFLNVGLAERHWPLDAVQMADAEVIVRFPSYLTDYELEAAAPTNFGTSDLKAGLEEVLAQSLTGNAGAFSVRGVAVHGGKIEPQATARRGLLRGLQDGGSQSEEFARQVKYTVTTRGSYDPPPPLQLGELVQESINADPDGVVKSLRDKEGLPPVFADVEGVEARHLTAKRPPVPGGIQAYQDVVLAAPEGGFPTWAIFASILLGFAIFALCGALLFRRVFVRRTKRVAVETKKSTTASATESEPLKDSKKRKGGLLRRIFGRQEVVRDDDGERIRAIPQEAQLGFFQRLLGRSREEVPSTTKPADEEQRRRRRKKRRSRQQPQQQSTSTGGTRPIYQSTSTQASPAIYQSASTRGSHNVLYQSASTQGSSSGPPQQAVQLVPMRSSRGPQGSQGRGSPHRASGRAASPRAPLRSSGQGQRASAEEGEAEERRQRRRERRRRERERERG